MKRYYIELNKDLVDSIKFTSKRFHIFYTNSVSYKWHFTTREAEIDFVLELNAHLAHILREFNPDLKELVVGVG